MSKYARWLEQNSGVVVLIGTYNGSEYLTEQLESISIQTIDNIDIVVSDDLSTDETKSVIRSYAEKWTKGDFIVVDGPTKGFAENYRHLIVKYGQSYDYVAFSDQDDIWDADKLEVAIAWLRQHPDRPALYCGRTRYVDKQGRYLRMSPLFSKPPDIRNALTQSIAGANTMVMNRPAARLMVAACEYGPIVAHDWWAYLVISACGGIVYYDPEPHISYRQHDGNVLGANDTFFARIERIIGLIRGRFAGWNSRNLAGLKAIDDLMTDQARDLVDLILRMRGARFGTRLALFTRTGLFRQTTLGSLGLIAAVVFGLV
jgi:glycosyltransferase involved in cell wall biosynthesis